MKNWMRRFTILALVGSLMCGALVAGCGGGDAADDTAAPAKKDDAAKDE